MSLLKNNSLDKLSNRVDLFISNTGFTPVFGAELEFYFLSPVSSSFLKKINNLNTLISDVTPEDGENQYEIVFNNTKDLSYLAATIETIKETITNMAKEAGVEVSFAAMPLENQPGSALNFHCHLEDANGNNVFIKNCEKESQIMLYAIAGMLAAMPAQLKHFFPHAESALRIGSSMNVPSTISWGGNNRTTAIRVPEHSTLPNARRIEHRVPGADADAFNVILCLLDGMEQGIINKLQPETAKIYGNAYDSQYGLRKLYDLIHNVEHKVQEEKTQ